jgi:dihydrodipicolinate synthase/N-acetylneuraminate lyase
MGEAIHLSHAERVTLIHSSRKALDLAGLDHVPIIAGIGGGATREVIQFGKEAAEAGADATIAILSGYYAGALASNRKALKEFWSEVAEKVPIPVIIYNCAFPPASVTLHAFGSNSLFLLRLYHSLPRGPLRC